MRALTDTYGEMICDLCDREFPGSQLFHHQTRRHMTIGKHTWQVWVVCAGCQDRLLAHAALVALEGEAR